MKHILLFACISLGLAGSLAGQDFRQQVVSPAGAYLEQTAENINFSVTAGEPVIFTAVGQQVALTQGFQQPYEAPVIVTGLHTGINRTEQQVTVFPNPFDAELTVQVNDDRQQHLSVYITDLAGRKIGGISQIDHTGGLSSRTFQTSVFPSGMYFLIVASADGKSSQTVKLTKLTH